jgi:hypothetical protein
MLQRREEQVPHAFVVSFEKVLLRNSYLLLQPPHFTSSAITFSNIPFIT